MQNPGITLLEKYAGKLDVGAAVGTDGMLTVIRDLQMKEPYVGSVALVSGEIGDDVTAYFAQSEQTPTAALIDRLEAGIRAAGAVTPMLSEGLTPEAMLRRVLDGFELEFLENTPVSYRCYCSRERVTSTLIAIGRKDLEEIVAEGKPINLECQFCDQVYTFTPEEISDLLKEI